MSSAAPEPAALPLGDVVAESFRLPWQRRGDFLKALAIPALAIAVVRIGWWRAEGGTTGMAWMTWAVHGVLWVLFAVACHRLVLLDLRRDQMPWLPGWGRRETIFLLSAVLACVTVMAAVWVAMIPVAIIVSSISQPVLEAIMNPFTAVLGTYVFARVALVLPAAAIGERVNLPEMWRATRGNGWRLAFVVGVLPWALNYLTDLIGGDDPGVAWVVVSIAAAVVLMTVEIAAISIAYRRLVQGRAG